MGRQIYLYEIDYSKLQESKTQIAEIIQKYLNIDEYYAKEKIDLAKLDDPSKFTVAEIVLLMDILEQNYFNHNPNSYPKIIGITEIYSTYTTADSNSFMELLLTYYLNLPAKHEDYIYYPLYKNDLLTFFDKAFNIIKSKSLNLSSSLQQLNDNCVYLLWDSY